MNAYRYVFYVIGMILSFPIRVLHIIPFDDSIKHAGKKPISSSPKSSYSNMNKNKNYTSQQGVKRNCGQSQQNIRLAHKSKQLPKDK